ncbi:MAG: AarF/ABC1/UbiB kinase family protein [Nitrospirota bacterium]|jgi:ubiquinone biosynthesis protein
MFGRFLAICMTLSRQLIHYLPRRVRIIPETKDKKEIKRYLKTTMPRITSPFIVRETIEKLGPTFVKFGQFLSIRPDLVPPEFCEELRKLQDEVPPFSFEFARAEIEKELGHAYTEIFSEFNKAPVASASVSQVHRARLKTGEEVAVKVQRPGVREKMETDILIMLSLAALMERFIPSVRTNRPRMLVKEFSRWTDRELDFSKEGKNAIQFSYCFKDYPRIKFPKVFLRYTTEKVLVMEFIKGVNILEVPREEAERKAIAHLVADSMLKQIFVDGFFHGDPHPGNLFLVEGNTVAYLDFGIVGYLTRELREWSFDILYGIAERDVNRIIDSFLELCNVNVEEVDVPSYRREINEVLSEVYVCEIAGIPFTCTLERFLNTSLGFGIDVPRDFVIMSKALATLEGTCMSLAPEIRIAEYLEPFVEKYIVVVPEFDEMVKKLKEGPFEMARLRRLASKHLRRSMTFLENPSFRFESAEFRNIVRELDKASVNISYGVIIASLVVFAATVSNESAFERWLRGILHLPVLPLLPVTSLVVAGYLWIRLYVRNRQKKK